MLRELRPASHKSHPTRNQRNPQPAQRTNMLMQHKSCDQRQQHVPQRSGRQNISKIGPGKRSHVGGKESQQKKNPNRNPRIEHREDNTLQMIKRDAAGLLHPMRKHGVASRGKHGNSGQHKILAKVHKKLSSAAVPAAVRRASSPAASVRKAISPDSRPAAPGSATKLPNQTPKKSLSFRTGRQAR